MATATETVTGILGDQGEEEVGAIAYPGKIALRHLYFPQHQEEIPHQGGFMPLNREAVEEDTLTIRERPDQGKPVHREIERARVSVTSSLIKVGERTRHDGIVHIGSRFCLNDWPKIVPGPVSKPPRPRPEPREGKPSIFPK